MKHKYVEIKALVIHWKLHIFFLNGKYVHYMYMLFMMIHLKSKCNSKIKSGKNNREFCNRED